MSKGSYGRLSPWFLRRLFFSIVTENLWETRAKGYVKDYRLRIRGNTPDMGLPGIVFSGCDDVYYQKFAAAFLLSAERIGEPLHIHLHFYGPSQATLDHIDQMRRTLGHVALSFTWEDDSYKRLALAEPVYFSAARFLVLHHLLLACRAPVLCVDIDSIVHRPLSDVFPMLERADVTLHFCLAEPQLEQRVMGAAVGMNHTKEALGFCERLAASAWRGTRLQPLDHFDQALLYGMYIVRRRLKRRIRWQQMPSGYLDRDFGEDSSIWAAGGRQLEGGMFARAALAIEQQFPFDIEAPEMAYVELRGDGTHG